MVGLLKDNEVLDTLDTMYTLIRQGTSDKFKTTVKDLEIVIYNMKDKGQTIRIDIRPKKNNK